MVDLIAPVEGLVLDRDGKSPIILELKETVYAESRIKDIAIVNPITLPELISVFLQSYSELAKVLGVLEAEITETEYKIDQRRAYLLLNEVDASLTKRGLKSSQDLRDAVIDLDDRYSTLTKIQNKLENVYAVLKNKVKVIEMGYFSCQKIADLKSNSSFKISSSGHNVDNVDNFGPGKSIRPSYIP